NLSGQNFTPTGDPTPPTPVSCGILSCGDPVSVTTYNSSDPRQFVTGTRGFWDKDGETCVNVNYYVTNTLPIDKKVHFRWPLSGVQSDPAATFKYVITGASPPPAGFPKVSWKNDSNGNPAFVSACRSVSDTTCTVPPCLSANLPMPYGSLTA